MKNTWAAFFVFYVTVVPFTWASTDKPSLHTTRPRVRTVTAFISIDREHYKEQFADAVKVLRSARTQFEKSGWELQSIRITTQPFPEYIKGLTHDAALAFLNEIDAIAVKEEFRLNIGPAMRTDKDDPAMLTLLGEFLAGAKTANANALMAGEDGIHWKVIKAAARMVKYVQEHSEQSQGNFNFTAAAMMPEYSPFYPASFHTGAGHKFAVGLQSANVVLEVFGSTSRDPAAASEKLKAELAYHSKEAENVALKIAKDTGWTYVGLDPTPAPLADLSIGAAIERYTGHGFGSSGTLTAARIITDAVKSVPVKQVGYSGLMLPVLDDRRIGQRWNEGALSMDALLAYSSVCATGLDAVPLPGDVSEEQIARILGDVASLAFKWKKPLTARLLPVKGKKVGEKTDFHDPFIENVVLQRLP